MIYPCSATRKEIERAASAPHESDGETRYPGLNRPALGKEAQMAATVPDVFADDAYAWRVIVPDGPV
ncbi:MAG: tRNA glutamyl-Q(34) synthetase GluQRS, partial [Pseudomonadota bacterium]